MPSKAKSKGNSSERETCKILSECFGGNFIRVPNSGAFLGGFNKFRKDNMDEYQKNTFKGDIITPENMKRLVIENKFYKDFPFHLLIRNEPLPILDKWIEQLLEPLDLDDFPFLVMKFNRKGYFLAIRKKDIENFKIKNYISYMYKNEEFYIVDFIDFIYENKDKILNKLS